MIIISHLQNQHLTTAMSDSDDGLSLEGQRSSRSRSRSGSRSGSASRSPSPSPSRSQGEEVEVENTDDPPKVTSDPVVSKVQFCSSHGVDLQPDTCNVCRHVGRMIRPEVMKELIKPKVSEQEAEVPSTVACFCRSDEPKPTLTFSDTSMELAIKIFSLGKFKIPHHFDNLTKVKTGRFFTLCIRLTPFRSFCSYSLGKTKH